MRQALEAPGVEGVQALSRRPLTRTHPKLQPVVLSNFLDYSALDLRKTDACIWALGTEQGSLSDREYAEVTVDYAVAAARALFAANQRARFCFVSGRSADPEERSKLLFARVKGRAERELHALGGEVYVFRPGYIQPTRKSGSRKDGARFFQPIGAMFAWLAPQLAVGCDQLAACLLDVASHGAGERLLLNPTLRTWSATSGQPTIGTTKGAE